VSASFIHQQAICETARVGRGTRIWAFAHILSGASIGEDCNVCDGVFIEDKVVIGDRVTIKSGVQLWDGIRIEDDVFIGPNATFANDKFPRSKAYPVAFLDTVVRRGASIGANATILPGVEIGAHAMVGAGAVVTRSVPANAIAVGNPAHIAGYVNARTACHEGLSENSPNNGQAIVSSNTGVRGVRILNFPLIKDMRGNLTVGEFEKDCIFSPKRFFMVLNVPSREVRGEHAHRICHQLLICVSGSCNVLVDDGSARREFVLDRPTIGIYVPPMIWGAQYKYSSDAVLLVFASEPYDAADYIRDYSEFRTVLAQASFMNPVLASAKQNR
jgi:UDP-2-acetamido-3-amino-2,3-dideoxy-glucuronate N-acetyltransferase